MDKCRVIRRPVADAVPALVLGGTGGGFGVLGLHTRKIPGGRVLNYLCNKANIHTEFISLLLSERRKPLEIDAWESINLSDNLNWGVLQDLLTMLGLPHTEYARKKVIFDDKLLGYRHPIAHGKKRDVDYEDFVLIYTEVLSLLSKFKDDIENAAALASFRIYSPLRII